MREAIRYLMVAAAVYVLILGTALAQGPAGGFEIPKSITNAFGDTAAAAADQARNAANSASRSLGLPEFTSAGDVQRASTRPGGPTTDPTTARDNSWLTDAAAQRGRPSTAPYNANGQYSAVGQYGASGQSAGNTASSPAYSGLQNDLRNNNLRSGGSAGTVATVGATEDPLSPEAQLRARLAENQGGASASQRSAQAGNSSGFGSLPDGITLPTRSPANAATATGGTFGSEFARNMSTSATSSPVYGPKTAAEANFDFSVFNAANNAANNANTQANSQTQAFGTAQQNLGMPNTYANPSAAASGNANRSALGMPGGVTASAGATLPPNWTYKQIAALGEYFGVASNDSRMSDQAFVDSLYAMYQEDQAKKAQANQYASNPYGSNQNSATQGNLASYATAANSNAGTSGTYAGNLWSRGDGASGTTGFNLPSSLDTPYQGQSRTQRDVAGADPRYASAGTINPPPQSVSQPAATGGRKVQAYDAFGNKIDADGNVLDDNLRPVDEATKFELTYGKKLKEQMEQLRLEQAALERSKLTQVPSSPSDRIAAAGFRGIQGAPGQSTGAYPDPSSITGGQRPPGGSLAGSSSNSGLMQDADQTAIGGAAKATGKANPWVNIFLLCSIMANGFLFVWLHRLWYYHRDLIASSRMATSGISNND
ncbi:MAG: hypothetical protein KDB00_14790 [Planctomycetales bacterium]|nr:hypothetical protein [Planctomycetales bacterium]